MTIPKLSKEMLALCQNTIFLQHFPIAALVASYATDAIILFQLLGILIDAILCNSTYFSQLLVCYIRVRLH